MEGGGLHRAPSSPQPFSEFWDVQELHGPASVHDTWRHRRVPVQSGRSLVLAAASTDSTGQGLANPVYGSIGKIQPFASSSHPSPGSTTVSLADLHLTQDTSYSSLSLHLGPQAALSQARTLAELSDRRREAIRAAYRRVDAQGSGTVRAQDLSAVLRSSSNLQVSEQAKLVDALLQGVGSGGGVTYADFAWYYQILGSSIELDRQFEEMLRHHWGFTEVSGILEDMKTKFALLGLAYTFRRSLESGASAEMTPAIFEEAIASVGMQYNEADVHRIFGAFNNGAQGLSASGVGNSLGVLQFAMHLTNAAQPRTPMPKSNGVAHFSEVNSVARGQSQLATPCTSQQASRDLPPASDRNLGGGHGGCGGCGAQAALPSRGRKLPPVETAPPEEQPQAFHEAVLPFMAPLEDSDHVLAPQERIGHTSVGPEPPKASPGWRPSGLGNYPSSPQSQATAPPAPSAASTAPPPVLSGSAPVAPESGRRRAVTIGINYLGHRVGTLAGCINDSDTFIGLLIEEFGYAVEQIRQLRDDHPQRMPTKKNIMAALNWLVYGVKAGDHLFLHYSGHGSHQADSDGDEADGKDETLVPCDYLQCGMLTDDELRRVLVQPLPKGARLTCVFDCCHSGSQLDLAYKVKLLPDNHTSEVQMSPGHASRQKVEADVVMISGCMDEQTSADIGSSGAAKAAGAMTTALRVAVAGNPTITHHQLLIDVRRYLKNNNFPQVPQYSTEHYLNLEDTFLPEAAPHYEHPPPSLRAPVRRALTIGINYLSLPSGRGRLAGCINDSETMIGVMKEIFQFEDSQICRLRDDRANMMPTKSNILNSIQWLTQGAGPGDEMFLHYSGHGGQQRDTNGDEADSMDETLIPCDFQASGMITDDDLYRVLVQDLPKGCRLWVILDCCHSGTALDLPFRVNIGMDGSSLTLGKPPANLRANVPSQAEVIMISGCQDDQTSADVQGGSMGVTNPAGAMTTAFRHTITPDITCEDLILNMRSFLQRNRFLQVPQFSSEQFVSLDASFVGYSHKKQNKRDLPATLPPQDQIIQMAPPKSPMVHPGGQLPAERQVIDSRISALEEQIHALRSHGNAQQPAFAINGACGAYVGSPQASPMRSRPPMSPSPAACSVDYSARTGGRAQSPLSPMMASSSPMMSAYPQDYY